jgi:hypothetical protein
MSAAAISTVMELAPTVLSGIETIANDVSSDTAAHKTVLQTASDALGSALTSTQAIASSSAVPSGVSSAIAASEETVTAAAGLVPEIESVWSMLKALIAKL